MQYVRTYARQAGPNLYRVSYSCKLSTLSGHIDVVLDEGQQDPAIAAELLAMHYLLSTLGVAGKERTGGTGLKLMVTNGAIRKLQRQDSAKAHLAPFAQFLQTRFLDADIEVDRKQKLWGEADDEVPVYRISGVPFFETVESAIAPLVLTQHVVERFIERGTNPGCQPSRAVSSITRMIKATECREVEPPQSMKSFLTRRYGSQARFMIHESTRMCFVVGKGALSTTTLISCYRLHERDRLYPVRVYHGSHRVE